MRKMPTISHPEPRQCVFVFNPLEFRGNYSATLNDMKFGFLAVDGWAVTFGTTRTGLSGLRPLPVPSAARPGPSSLYQM